MKKKTILLAVLMSIMPLSNVCVNAAQVEIPLQVGYTDPSYGQGGPKKIPPRIPQVMIDGQRMSFATNCDGFTLTLIDEDGEVAYQTVVPSATTSLTLPSWLSGEYEIRLQPSGSSIYFYGWITLQYD